jgi:uncharacterized protein with HEPN domain
MSPNENNDLMYLLNILEYIGKIWDYTAEADDAESLYEMNDQLNFNASLTLMANIGENISKISDALKAENTDIAWRQIKDFRNIIVHNYVGIDIAIVWEVITNDLKEIKPKIENIIKLKLKNGIFDINELNVTKGSPYYKHINYRNMIEEEKKE